MNFRSSLFRIIVLSLSVLGAAAGAFSQTMLYAPHNGNVGSSSTVNVGIGIMSPDYPLHVYKNANASNLIMIDNPDTGSAVFTGVDSTSDKVSLSVRAYGSGFSTFSHAGVTLTQAVELWADTMSGTGPQAFLVGIATTKPLIFATANTERMRIDGGGNVGIGTTNPGSYKLAVEGWIRARKVVVDQATWPDFVFADDYRLAPLSEVEAHIRDKKHLPGIPSAAEVAEQGVSLGDMQARLLAKVEELTLHQIAQEKRIAALEQENARLRQQPQR